MQTSTTRRDLLLAVGATGCADQSHVNVIVNMSTFPVALKLLVVLIATLTQTWDVCGLRIARWTEIPAFDLVTGESNIDREPVFANRGDDAAGEPSQP
jgi:hypothetical protein